MMVCEQESVTVEDIGLTNITSRGNFDHEVDVAPIARANNCSTWDLGDEAGFIFMGALIHIHGDRYWVKAISPDTRFDDLHDAIVGATSPPYKLVDPLDGALAKPARKP